MPELPDFYSLLWNIAKGSKGFVSPESDEPVIREKAFSVEQMSISDLEERISLLRNEISLCEQAIERKKAQKRAADALFGPGAGSS